MTEKKYFIDKEMFEKYNYKIKQKNKKIKYELWLNVF